MERDGGRHTEKGVRILKWEGSFCEPSTSRPRALIGFWVLSHFSKTFKAGAPCPPATQSSALRHQQKQLLWQRCRKFYVVFVCMSTYCMSHILLMSSSMEYNSPAYDYNSSCTRKTYQRFPIAHFQLPPIRNSSIYSPFTMNPLLLPTH